MPQSVPRFDLSDPGYLARLGQLSEVELRAAAFAWAADLVRRGASVGVDAATELAELKKPPFGDLNRDEAMAVYGQPTRREENWILDHGRMDLLEDGARLAYLRQRLTRIGELEREVRREQTGGARTSALADALFEQAQAERPPADASTATEVSFQFSDAQVAVLHTQPQRLALWAAALKSQQATDVAAGRPARAWWSQDATTLATTLGVHAQVHGRTAPRQADEVRAKHAEASQPPAPRPQAQPARAVRVRPHFID